MPPPLVKIPLEEKIGLFGKKIFGKKNWTKIGKDCPGRKNFGFWDFYHNLVIFSLKILR